MSKFNQSLFSAERRVIDARPPSPDQQLQSVLDDMEARAKKVLDAQAVSAAVAVTRPANTPACRAGRIVAGVSQVRASLTSAPAEAVMQMYALMQQFAAASLDEWQEEANRGINAVQRQQGASSASKKRPCYEAAARYMLTKYGKSEKPAILWAMFKAEGARKIEGRAVEIIDAGKKIKGSGSAPITRRVFIDGYLKPAQKAARTR